MIFVLIGVPYVCTPPKHLGGTMIPTDITLTVGTDTMRKNVTAYVFPHTSIDL